jgi:hypothetical protein
MSTFTNSITNIVNSGYINSYTSKHSSDLTKIIKTASIDSVNFSTQSKNLLSEQLTSSESQKLGTLSLQLKRLLFDNGDNNNLTSYLNLFNDLYGLNDPNEQELFDATNFVAERNSLLSSLILNRSFSSTYSN